MKKQWFFFVSTALSLMVSAQISDELSKKVALPPVQEFHGKSLELMTGENDPWITPSEKTDLTDTPSYDETVEFLNKLVSASDSLEMVSLGKSREGRDFWMVIASNDGYFTPEAIVNSGVPVLLAQAGIHSGEIDGKDAGLMLLRDMTVGKKKTELLDDAVFLFIPILSVDGHERRSEFNRINQRGPIQMGWRTNAGNLNLNRDYTKADTEGIRAVLKCLHTYRPSLYFDIHVTDGIDYQYDVTLGANGINGFSPAVGAYFQDHFLPSITKALQSWGHIPGPLIFAKDNRDMSKGIVGWFSSPRFSNGYGDLVHVPTILVENHSLKPYKQRVLGTYVLLEESIRLLKKQGAVLKEAIEKDRSMRVPRIAAKRVVRDETHELEFLGVESESYQSVITGQEEVRWLGKPITLRIPYIERDKPEDFVQKPKAFWVPAGWPDIIARLKLHGVEMEVLKTEKTETLTFLKFGEPEFDKKMYEGHLRVKSDFVEFRHQKRFMSGGVRIPLDQPLGDLIMVLLDPRFSDSFFQWGFFNQIFQRTEYTEAYAIAPYAEKMLKNPLIMKAFEKKLENDENFRKNRRARLYWFYEKTPYYDQEWKVYPIGREE